MGVEKGLGSGFRGSQNTSLTPFSWGGLIRGPFLKSTTLSVPLVLGKPHTIVKTELQHLLCQGSSPGPPVASTELASPGPAPLVLSTPPYLVKVKGRKGGRKKRKKSFSLGRFEAQALHHRP